jgi:hypothetical protein
VMWIILGGENFIVWHMNAICSGTYHAMQCLPVLYALLLSEMKMRYCCAVGFYFMVGLIAFYFSSCIDTSKSVSGCFDWEMVRMQGHLME